MTATTEWIEGGAPGISAARLNEPFHVRAAVFDSGNNRINVTIGPGRASFLGTIVERLSDTVHLITAPVINTTYHIYVHSNNTFSHNTTGAELAGAVRLGTVRTGAALTDPMTRTDVRGQLPGAAARVHADAVVAHGSVGAVVGVDSSITIDPAPAPTGNVGGLRALLGWLANRIRAITGAANWWDAPATTLAAAQTHHGRTDNPHSVTAMQVGAAVGQYSVFTASGTWTRPAGAVWVMIQCFGAGGGGAGGISSTISGNPSGGGGGGGGAVITRVLPAALLGATEPVTVGVGGAGGDGQFWDTANFGGSDGGASSFGAHARAFGGRGSVSGPSPLGGEGGSAGAPNIARLAGNNQLSGVGGGPKGNAEFGGGGGGDRDAYPGGSSIHGGGGGGSGSSGAGEAAGSGGANNSYTPGGGGAAGSPNGGMGGVLQGGGGGVGNNGGDGITAGHGGSSLMGGGGGGGGGRGNATNSTRRSGAGGAGGRGEVRVWSF